MSACMFIKFQCSRLSFTASVLKIQRGQSSLVVRTPSEVKGVGKSSHSSLGKWARVKGKQQHPQIQWDLLGMFGLREESEKYHCENSDGVYTVTMLETRLRCPCISCCLDLASPKLVVLVWVLFFSLSFHCNFSGFVLFLFVCLLLWRNLCFQLSYVNYLTYNHQRRRKLGVFWFREIPRLWKERGDLRKPKSNSITQVYDKEKLGN